MRNLQKLLASILLLTAAFIFFYPAYAYNQWIIAWDFGFLVHSTGDTTNRLSEYINQMHAFSPVYIQFVKIMQSLFGSTAAWIRYPGGIMLLVLFWAYLRDLQWYIKALVLVVGLGGPLFHFPSFFYLRRDILNLVVIMSFVVVVVRIIPRYRQNWLYSMVGGGAVLLLWGLHYTVWPFLAGITVLYPVFVNQDIIRKKRNRQVFISLITIGFVFYLHSAPIVLYAASAVYVTKILPELLMSGEFFSPHRLTIENPVEIVDMTLNSGFSYYPTSWILGSLIVGLLMATIFGWYWQLLVRRPRDLFSQPPSVAILLAAICSFGLLAVILMVRGYFTRIFYFWPVMFVLFVAAGYDIFASVDTTRGLKLARQAVIVLVVILVVVNFINVLPAQEMDPTPSASERQAAYFSGSHVRGTIYTSLGYASPMLIHTDHRTVRVGVVESLANESVALNQQAALLVNPDRLKSGCVLTTGRSNSWLTMWGANIPVKNPVTAKTTSRVYTNGGSTLFCSI